MYAHAVAPFCTCLCARRENCHRQAIEEAGITNPQRRAPAKLHKTAPRSEAEDVLQEVFVTALSHTRNQSKLLARTAN
jgi:DNA-directed RNA polymerase specialized sigma24 family protein